MKARPWLGNLAEQVGILPEYVDNRGCVRRTSDSTRERLVTAMGYACSSEREAQRSVETMRTAAANRLLPEYIIRNIDPGARLTVPLCLPQSWHGEIEWQIEVRTEPGHIMRTAGTAEAASGTAQVDLDIGTSPPSGVHTIRVVAETHEQRLQDRQVLIIAPPRCVTPADVLGDGRALGVSCNLYTIRSASNWGIGNLGDIHKLIDWSAQRGVDFVGLNPLHALSNRRSGTCPYQPLSRLFHNLIYLDITAVPEWNDCPKAHRLLSSDITQHKLNALRNASHIEYAETAALIDEAMCRLHETFELLHADNSTTRGADYRCYVASKHHLQEFATFLALDAHFNARGVHGGWPTWPAEYRDPNSLEVQRFRAAHANDVARHCYVQFELDRQLGACAEHATRVGLSLGLYGDLAVGSAVAGFDTWLSPSLFVEQASLGAPPDAFCESGQDWQLTPIHPQRLGDEGFTYWTDLLQTALQHCGALRIDHVMGLARQFWIPRGATADEGAYVRFPVAALCAIAAIESHRSGTLIVGEDLGTVEGGFRDLLHDRGMLRSQVLMFERDNGGYYLPAGDYARDAVVSANTHDLVPLAGYWHGTDIDLHERLGMFPDDEGRAQAKAQRMWDRAALLARLQFDGLLPDETYHPYPDVRRAVHAFLERTPARLVLVALDDLAGEIEPINIPGVDTASRPLWSRRMRVDLEALLSDPDVLTAIEAASPQSCQR